jgi:signal transduction histidine kinase
MSDIAFKLRKHWVEVAWGLFAVANAAAIVLLSKWTTVPFHFIWVSLTLVYGYRVWSGRATWSVLAGVTLVTGVALAWSVIRVDERPDELTEVPLMAAMFVAMVWHARRARAASEEVQRLAESEHRLLERQREFVRDASHELRTPITVAKGHAELIRSAPCPPQVAEDLEVVLDELDRLSRVSERLLILAGAEHPNFLRRRPVALGKLLAGMNRRWSAAAPRRWSVRVTTDGTVLADEERLGFAIDSLIENAVKFTREGDQIAVVGGGVGDRAVIEISDTGEGIPLDKQDGIFDRFTRVDSGRARASGGTGLGLAIVKAVVEAHGGTVDVQSQPGAGSTFRISLPFFRSTEPRLTEQAGTPLEVAG